MGHLRTKELSKIGYTNDRTRSLVVNIMAKHFKHHDKADIITLLTNIKTNPAAYADDAVVGPIAATFMEAPVECNFQSYALLESTGQLKVYGAKEIERTARQQMEMAMSLPVTLQGALMPDAHTGYGLPIGGVLATDNAIIPYAVGVDIGCRMALTIIDEGASFLKRYAYQIKVALKEYTHFGMEGGLPFEQEHAVLDDALFDAIPLLKKWQGKAARQLGSSGSGNHFVEFGLITLEPDNALQLPAKEYLALLSHSGSRGLGANIAQHYTGIAMDTCKLPRSVQQLAWLDLNTEAGQEYWLSMHLAGDYAKACHDRIHANLLKALGLQGLATVENHHNFAWEDQLADGRKAIIHRKGATPAHAGEMGIIPGSMTTAAYLVMGKGIGQALYSASHGAGRAMSRKRAKESMTVSHLKKMLAAADVTLIGGSVEENPLAYKDIEKVMPAQQELVAIQGRFMPSIVRMNKD
ncbi:RtcB family protein [Chitinophaga nivalis]|uniref:3'-phosphate/5'-hydroxy nucleic acid ligase n=1 Tax=Chitinophaga nivalis TaxID=2991709 RepID=A0ABT3IGI6_9BACT|nr:RtcB family protein [Chitinophaga nivalis]MCW3467256.1 RtcB family protein [Chitinophaga nivalis]MCW3483052.1 RtcB family protein [Chitinophaga nivalis]